MIQNESLLFISFQIISTIISNKFLKDFLLPFKTSILYMKNPVSRFCIHLKNSKSLLINYCHKKIMNFYKSIGGSSWFSNGTDTDTEQTSRYHRYRYFGRAVLKTTRVETGIFLSCDLKSPIPWSQTIEG